MTVVRIESGEIGRPGVVVVAGGVVASFKGDDGRAVFGEGAAGVGVTPAGRANDAAVAPPRSLRGEEPRERCRTDPGETCGSLCAGPGPAESCGAGTSTTDEPRESSPSSAEGEAATTPKSTTAL